MFRKVLISFRGACGPQAVKAKTSGGYAAGLDCQPPLIGAGLVGCRATCNRNGFNQHEFAPGREAFEHSECHAVQFTRFGAALLTARRR